MKEPEDAEPTVGAPSFGTRYEFTRESAEGDAAEYAVTVQREGSLWRARVALGGGQARMLEKEEALPAEALAQLLALGKTLARHAEEAGWPRRRTLWRQPGVR